MNLSSRLTARLLARLPDQDLADLDRLLKEERYDKLDARCGRAELDPKGWAKTTCGPMFWLQHLTRTIDDHAAAKGTPAKMPFPAKSYFLPLMAELLRPMVHPSPDCHRLLICKSREMLSSWLTCGYVCWACQWRPGTVAIIQTLKEAKSAELVRYCAILAENQEPFLKERHPLTYSNMLEIGWANGSRIFGIPAGEHQIRTYHPAIVLFDEMAFMVDAEACWNAVLPVAKQVIGVSSAHFGWMGDQCSSV
jgi:hypothetical protein